jgi:small subunit ribosomal protein S21
MADRSGLRATRAPHGIFSTSAPKLLEGGHVSSHNARLPQSTLAGLRAEKGLSLQILVRDNNVDQAMKVLKKKLQREGVLRELKRQRYYEKPSERKAREKSEAIRRGRKLARKRAQREGLLPMPKLKPKREFAKPPRF